jgi:hypothetical protein
LVRRTLMAATRNPARPMERISLMGTVSRARKPMATVEAEMRRVRPAWRAAITAQREVGWPVAMASRKRLTMSRA